MSKKLDPNRSPMRGLNTTPTLPLTTAQKVRCGLLAKELENAKVQGHVEANFAGRLLDFVQELLPLILKR